MSSVIKKHKQKIESYLGSLKDGAMWRKTINNAKPRLSDMANPVFDTFNLNEVTRLEEFTEQKEAEPFFNALIKLIGIAFKRERNQNTQAPIYRSILMKLFSHDLNLLEKAAKELGFWFKNQGNGKALLSWSLSKTDIDKYKAE